MKKRGWKISEARIEDIQDRNRDREGETERERETEIPVERQVGQKSGVKFFSFVFN